MCGCLESPQMHRFYPHHSCPLYSDRRASCCPGSNQHRTDNFAVEYGHWNRLTRRIVETRLLKRNIFLGPRSCLFKMLRKARHCEVKLSNFSSISTHETIKSEACSPSSHTLCSTCLCTCSCKLSVSHGRAPHHCIALQRVSALLHSGLISRKCLHSGAIVGREAMSATERLLLILCEGRIVVP